MQPIRFIRVQKNQKEDNQNQLATVPKEGKTCLNQIILKVCSKTK
jgi:hypothetical protein